MKPARTIQAAIPSVDRILALAPIDAMVAEHGREAVVRAVRDVVESLRTLLGANARAAVAETTMDKIVAQVAARLEAAGTASMKPVFNLTGTILHTNLGGAVLPQEAVQAIAAAATHAVNLEFDLQAGKRDDRVPVPVAGRACPRRRALPRFALPRRRGLLPESAGAPASRCRTHTDVMAAPIKVLNDADTDRLPEDKAVRFP